MPKKQTAAVEQHLQLLIQHSVTISCAFHLGLAVLLGCFMQSVVILHPLHVSCVCQYGRVVAAVATAIVLLSKCFIAAPMLHP